MAKLLLAALCVVLLVAIFNGVVDKVRGKKTVSRKVAGWYFKSMAVLVGVPLTIALLLMIF